MKDLILFYEKSCQDVQNRIDQLTEWISTSNDSEVIQNFETRRKTLKTQVIYMKEVIEILKGYLKRWDMCEKEKDIC